LVRTIDTDVVANFVGKFHKLLEQNPAADVWLAFGAGKWFRHIHINTICNALGKHKSMALPVLHSFTGCDTTSAFWKRQKISMGCMEFISRGHRYISLHRFSSPYHIK